MAWVASTPVGGQQLDQLRLAGHGVGLEQPGDAVLALGLAELHRRHASPGTEQPAPGAPRTACMRLAGLGPDPAAGPVEHGRGDLLAAVGGQAVQDDGVGRGAGHQLVVDREPGEGLASELAPRPPGPSTSTRRCRRVGAGHRLPGRSSPRSRRPGAATRARSSASGLVARRGRPSGCVMPVIAAARPGSGRRCWRRRCRRRCGRRGRRTPGAG